MSYYIHNIDPIILPIWGNLAIRWYGLAYIAGFFCAYALLNALGRRGWFALQGEKLQAMLITVIIGTMIGGRLGYMLFYDLDTFLANPLTVIQLWKGGMASHGGIIGLTLACLYCARKYNIPFLHITDGWACVSTLGIFFGRVANFINGELWGRPGDVPWAVVFPQEAGLFHGDPLYMETAIQMLSSGAIQPRHPSQLYEAALEGLLIFAVLMTLRRTKWAAVHGRLSGVFLCLYAVVRFLVEFVREPEITHFGWMTQGQLLSIAILLPVGIGVIAWTYRKRGPTAA